VDGSHPRFFISRCRGRICAEEGVRRLLECSEREKGVISKKEIQSFNLMGRGERYVPLGWWLCVVREDAGTNLRGDNARRGSRSTHKSIESEATSGPRHLINLVSLLGGLDANRIRHHATKNQPGTKGTPSDISGSERARANAAITASLQPSRSFDGIQRLEMNGVLALLGHRTGLRAYSFAYWRARLSGWLSELLRQSTSTTLPENLPCGMDN